MPVNLKLEALRQKRIKEKNDAWRAGLTIEQKNLIEVSVRLDKAFEKADTPAKKKKFKAKGMAILNQLHALALPGIEEERRLTGSRNLEGGSTGDGEYTDTFKLHLRGRF